MEVSSGSTRSTTQPGDAGSPESRQWESTSTLSSTPRSGGRWVLSPFRGSQRKVAAVAGSRTSRWPCAVGQTTLPFRISSMSPAAVMRFCSGALNNGVERPQRWKVRQGNSIAGSCWPAKEDMISPVDAEV